MFTANQQSIVGEKKAAVAMGLAVQTLRNMRHQRRGPVYLKIGRSVRYDLQDIEAYLQKRKIDPEA